MADDIIQTGKLPHMDNDSALAWRLEGAFDAAWPGLVRTEVEGWLCKTTPGVSRRANSANPLSFRSRLTDAALAGCETAYRVQGQRAYFRLPSVLSPEVDRMLKARGYMSEGATLTLAAPLSWGFSEAELTLWPSADWVAAVNAMNGRRGAAAAIFQAAVSVLKVPAAFAAIRREGRIVSAAYGAISNGWLCLEAVVTDSAWRGQGLAAEVIAGLTAWAWTEGADGAALQVSHDNAAARRLYARLGFDREVYRYHYRRQPPDAFG